MFHMTGEIQTTDLAAAISGSGSFDSKQLSNDPLQPMVETNSDRLEGHSATIGTTITVRHCAGRPRGVIWQFFKVDPCLQYSYGVHYVHFNLCHPEWTPNGEFEAITAMSDQKERTMQTDKTKMIAGNPNFISRHMLFPATRAHMKRKT